MVSLTSAAEATPASRCIDDTDFLKLIFNHDLQNKFNDKSLRISLKYSLIIND